MKTLRTIHLLLGCLFAPLLLLFAVSGTWQRLPPSIARGLPSWIGDGMALLSTLHTGRALKLGQTLSSGLLTVVVIAMSVSLVLTIVLGVVMTFRFGPRKLALTCLVLGAVVPAVVCMATYNAEKVPKEVSPKEAPATEPLSGPGFGGEYGLAVVSPCLATPEFGESSMIRCTSGGPMDIQSQVR